MKNLIFLFLLLSLCSTTSFAELGNDEGSTNAEVGVGDINRDRLGQELEPIGLTDEEFDQVEREIELEDKYTNIIEKTKKIKLRSSPILEEIQRNYNNPGLHPMDFKQTYKYKTISPEFRCEVLIQYKNILEHPPELVRERQAVRLNSLLIQLYECMLGSHRKSLSKEALEGVEAKLAYQRKLSLMYVHLRNEDKRSQAEQPKFGPQ